MLTPLAIVRFTPKPGKYDEVETILRRMVPATRNETGCRRYDLFKIDDPAGARLFYLVEHYRDEAAIGAHRETAHYKAYRAEVLPLLEHPPQVQLLQALDAKPY